MEFTESIELDQGDKSEELNKLKKPNKQVYYED